MAFVVRFRQSARDELDHCVALFGPQFAADVHLGLEQLADEAERGGSELSVDAVELLTRATGEQQASLMLKQWWRAGLATKLTALWSFLHDRCPPWQFRMAEGEFQVLNPRGPIPLDVPILITVFYEVNRTTQRLIVTLFRSPRS